MIFFPIQESFRELHLDCLRAGLVTGLSRSSKSVSNVLPKIPEDGHEAIKVMHDQNARDCVAFLNRIGKGQNPDVLRLFTKAQPRGLIILPPDLSAVPVSPPMGLSDERLYETDLFFEASLLMGALWLAMPHEIAVSFLDHVNWQYYLRERMELPAAKRISDFLKRLDKTEAYHTKIGQQLESDPDLWMNRFLYSLFSGTFFTHKKIDFAVGSSCEVAESQFRGSFQTHYPWRNFKWDFNYDDCVVTQMYGPAITGDFFERLKETPVEMGGSKKLSLLYLCADNGVRIQVFSISGEKVFEYDGRHEEECDFVD